MLILHGSGRHNLLGNVATGPVGQTFRVISDIEETLCLPIETGQIEHAEELCNLDAQRSTLQVTVYHLIYKGTQFTLLELVVNLLFEDGMVHHREVMMDVERQVVPQLQLRISPQFIPDEAEQAVRTHTRPDGRSPPGDIVVHLLLIGQHGSSLRVVVTDGSLRQSAVLLIEDVSLRIALWHKRLIDDVGEYQTDILVKFCFIPPYVGTPALAVSEVVESIPCVLLRLILPTVLDSAHSRVMSENDVGSGGTSVRSSRRVWHSASSYEPRRHLRYVFPLGKAHPLSVRSIEDHAVVRIGIRGAIVAIEVHRAGIVAIVRIAETISTAKTACEGSTCFLGKRCKVTLFPLKSNKSKSEFILF